MGRAWVAFAVALVLATTAVLALIIDWAEGQIRQLGRRDARDLAEALFAGIQGAALLANTFRDPAILGRQTRHLERWIDTLTRV